MASYAVTVSRKVFESAVIRVEAGSREEAIEIAPAAAERDPTLAWTSGDPDEGSAFAEEVEPLAGSPTDSLRQFTVQCGFNEPSSSTVSVTAATIEEALDKAIEEANDNEDWRRSDAGDIYIDAVCEGPGNPLDHPLLIPVRYTKQGEPPLVRIPDGEAAALDLRSGRIRLVRIHPDGTVAGDEIVTAVSTDDPETAHDAIAERQRIRRIGANSALVEERIVPGDGETTTAAADVVVHTDGFCSGNRGPGGWGAVIDDGAAVREISGREAHTTNNRIQLIAVIRALDAVEPGPRIHIVTASMYVLDGITEWIAAWKLRNWCNSVGKPIKNRDLWQELEQSVDRHGRLAWQDVYGHPGITRADELARAAATECG